MKVQKQKPILVPDEILLDYLTPEELRAFAESKTGIFSITVYAEKPGEKRKRKPMLHLSELGKANCCEPGSGCC